MSPYMHGSSPLSSADSVPTPPGACVDDSPALAPASNPAIAAEPTLAPKPDPSQDGTRALSPSGSVNSSTSTASKKRAHAEVEDPQTPMAPGKRVKKAAPQTAPKNAPKNASKTTSKTAPKAARKAAGKATPPAPPVGTRSSGRARKAPERFTDLPSPPKATAAPRKAGSKIYEPVHITTNSSSRLTKSDVFHMLLEANAWTCLTSDQKLKILALLPSNTINVKLANDLRAGTAAENARPREVSLNFNLFRTDVAKFKEDLENGHLAKTWQASAEQAIKARAAGAFDDWKESEAELWWGQN
ncbi:uncharacterized protein N0V89_009979 [Didymosphaeria variabile]|uniref:ASX DEUBAD domain-containing protein n=1 Tax=Didymosphaeria variabile TaxID=1932322 RepID=A0A9W8XEC4_9PLEO|nr:uncharacterized protein N0V89_009979 [Didymosphaeria variabile]KAJ4348601.1 hypothetical protein N0V89_009979 [Didymosphaeria variabile]